MQLKKGDILYCSRILPNVQIFEVCELKIRTISDTWFVGIDKRDKHAYLFSHNKINEDVFFNRNEALLKVLDSEKHFRNIDSDII